MLRNVFDRLAVAVAGNYLFCSSKAHKRLKEDYALPSNV